MTSNETTAIKVALALAAAFLVAASRWAADHLVSKAAEKMYDRRSHEREED